MLQNLMAIALHEDGNYYFSNKISESLIYALLGVAIVFVGIVIIILIIWLVGLLIRKTDNFKKIAALFKHEKKTEKEQEPLTEAEEDIPDEVKAAIVAAIMSYYSAEKPKCDFVVKRIKRI